MSEIQNAIMELCLKLDSTPESIKKVIDEIFDGTANDAQISAFLTAMSIKGETIEELVAASVAVKKKYDLIFNNKPYLEIIGTGGDKLNTFNISTAVAFLVATVGIPVIKFGNTASTGNCGAADVIEALGANISNDFYDNKRILERVGFCFVHNNLYPPIYKQIAKIRNDIGIVTIINKLRWLNPSGTTMEFLGVYKDELVEPLAKALLMLGVNNAIVVHGMDGMDEVSLNDKTHICTVSNGKLDNFYFEPEEYGFKKASLLELKGGNVNDNANIIKNIFFEKEKSAKRDITILNAAVIIRSIKPNLHIKEILLQLEYAIDSGEAEKKIHEYIYETNLINGS